VVRIISITRVELMRFLRERSNIFFVFVFPLLLVALIGAQFGGDDPVTSIGMVAPAPDAATDRLVDAIESGGGVEVTPYDDEEALAAAVGRGSIVAGIAVPADLGASLEAVRPVEVTYIGRPDTRSMAVRSVVDAALRELAETADAAQLAGAALGTDAAALVPLAEQVTAAQGGVEVTSTTLGEDELAAEFAGLEQFDIGASSQLFLFTFLTSLSGAAALIQTRQYGVARRMAATPTSTTTIVLGHGAGRLAVALVQAGYIVVASALLFRVQWGDPLGTTLIVVAFACVSAAAGMLVGATFKNDSQASGVGVGLGIGLAALGGSMVPLELFPDGVRAVARITPHSWANEAMAELVRRGGTLTDVLPQLGVLVAMAVVLFALASWQLRGALVR
jgi:ABC-2 type transport system permease protein